MNEVKVNRVIFNLYHVVGNFPHCHRENLGEMFYKVANNSFELYVVFVQIYLRVFFKLMKPITELVTDTYLQETSSIKSVKELKSKIKRTLLSRHIEAGTNLFRYLNLTLNNSAFEHYFITYRAKFDYIEDNLKILNLKCRFLSLLQGILCKTIFFEC